jgi:hypothetical protein
MRRLRIGRLVCRADFYIRRLALCVVPGEVTADYRF